MQHAVMNLHDSSEGWLTPNATVTLIEQLHNIYCIAHAKKLNTPV